MDTPSSQDPQGYQEALKLARTIIAKHNGSKGGTAWWYEMSETEQLQVIERLKAARQAKTVDKSYN